MTPSTVASNSGRIGDMGEKSFISHVLSRYARTARTEAKEDCVVLDSAQLFGSDDLPFVVYSIDHPSRIDRPLPEGLRWRFYGRWVAGCTCNDVLAMGAQPRGFSLDLAAPPDLDIALVGELYDGITDVLTTYGAVFEGGNVDINDRVETVGMCWGTVSRSGIVRRRGARPGDYVAVTTELGLGWASFVLRREGAFDRLRPAMRAELEAYNLMPVAPHHRAVVEAVERLPGAITSGMDLSDGLAEFLYTIAETGALGVEIEEGRFPASQLLQECARALGVPAAALGIEYGYDMPRGHGYTVDPRSWDAVERVFREHGAGLHRLGQVTSGPDVVLVAPSGATRPVPRLWDDKCMASDMIPRWRQAAGAAAQHGQRGAGGASDVGTA
jgi:thiamine-monophosphate kinase